MCRDLLFALLVATVAPSPAQEAPERFRLNHVALEVLPLSRRGTSGAELAAEYGWQLRTRRVHLAGFRPRLGRYQPRIRSLSLDRHRTGTQPRRRFPAIRRQGELEPPAGGAGRPPARIRVPGNRLPVAAGRQYGPHEILLVWRTRDTALEPLALHSEGFYRLQPRRGDYGQPLVWFQHRRLARIGFGTEVEVAGGRLQPLFGVKVTLW